MMTRERRAPGFFRRAYDGRPPWDIGRPQRGIVSAEEEGSIRGAVLDVGCGTGDNALFLAERGHEVLGVDLAPNAIEEARRKAAERGLAGTARFEVRDVIEAPAFGAPFGTVTDCGFFHALDDLARVRFAASLARLLEPDGRYVMLCFSDRVPGTFGPRRVSAEEIRETFTGDAWEVEEVRPARLESSSKLIPWVPAWLAVVRRV